MENNQDILSDVLEEWISKQKPLMVEIMNRMMRVTTNQNTIAEWKNTLISEQLRVLQEMNNEMTLKIDNMISEITRVMTECRQIGIQLCKPHLPDQNTNNKHLEVMLQEAEQMYKVLNEEKQKRVDKLKRFERKEKELCNKLDIALCGLWKTTEEILPSENDLAMFEHRLEELSNELYVREEKYITLKEEILKNAALLKYEPNLDFQKTVLYGKDEDFKLSELNIKQLESFSFLLRSNIANMNNEIQDLREQLQSLWERLEIHPHERSNFLSSYTENDKVTYNALKEEVNKLEEEKRQNISKFVHKLRNELIQIWDLCQVDEKKRSAFLYMDYEMYTEELLEIHELEISKWTKYYEKYKSLYSLINQRLEILEKLDELNKNAQDPDRYKNRGGKLLKEEQERKKAESSLPKVEKRIIELADAYEDENNEAFSINGKDIKQIISDRVEQIKKDKQLKLSARKNQTTLLTTPSKTLLTTPHKTPLGAGSRTPRSATSCKKNLLTPFNGKVPRTAPVKAGSNGKILKSRRISIERGKKIKTAVKRLSTSSRKENNPSLLNITQTKEYVEFAKGNKSRSTMYNEANGKHKQIEPESPLAMVLPKSPHLGHAGRTPLKSRNYNGFSTALDKGEEIF